MFSNIKILLDKLSKNELEEVLDYISNRMDDDNDTVNISTIEIEYIKIGQHINDVKQYISEHPYRYLFLNHNMISVEQIDDVSMVLIDDCGCKNLILKLNDFYLLFTIEEYYKIISSLDFDNFLPYKDYIIYCDDSNRKEADNNGYFYTIECPYCGSELNIKRDIWDGSDYVTKYFYDDWCDDCEMIYSIVDSEIGIDIPEFIFKLIRDGYYKLLNGKILLPISLADKISLENFKTK